MRCHHCGSKMELVDFRKEIDEALWECTNSKCKKTELVMSGIREPDPNHWFFED